nr:hypothetical protein [Tanacetum cinerariifolium]
MPAWIRPRVYSASSLGMPVMYVGFQAKTSRLFVNSWTSWFFTQGGRNSITDLILDTSILSFWMAALQSIKLYLDVDLTVSNCNIIFFDNDVIRLNVLIQPLKVYHPGVNATLGLSETVLKEKAWELGSRHGRMMYTTTVFHLDRSKMVFSRFRNLRSVVRRIILAAAVYYILKERNSRIFNDTKFPCGNILQMIMENIMLQIQRLQVKKSKQGVWMMKLNQEELYSHSVSRIHISSPSPVKNREETDIERQLRGTPGRRAIQARVFAWGGWVGIFLLVLYWLCAFLSSVALGTCMAAYPSLLPNYQAVGGLAYGRTGRAIVSVNESI